MITEQKLEPEVNFGLKAKERLKELIFDRLSKLLLYGSFFYVFFLFTSVITAYFFGYSVLTHYISDLGRQAVFPFSWLHDSLCVFAGAISVPVTVSFSKKLEVRYKNSKHSLLFANLRKLGAYGLVVPMVLLFLNCVFPIPIFEWLFYYSIIALILVLDCYVFIK